MAVDCAIELRPHNVAFVSLWPGAAKTELSSKSVKDPKLMKRIAHETGVDEEVFKQRYKFRESVEYVGKCVVALATDKNVMSKSGKCLITSDLGDLYGFVDDDGHKPINIRRVNCLLTFAPSWLSWIGWFVPDFVKIPKWLLSFRGHKL